MGINFNIPVNRPGEWTLRAEVKDINGNVTVKDFEYSVSRYSIYQ